MGLFPLRSIEIHKTAQLKCSKYLSPHLQQRQVGGTHNEFHSTVSRIFSLSELV
ncbi:hypothetical protein J6590_082508 [Homalodisca vitripennis]|nr:hypothetical protein J6590_082508 [Homalodisca vitripennis]